MFSFIEKKCYELYITFQNKESFANSRYNTRTNITDDSNWREENREDVYF